MPAAVREPEDSEQGIRAVRVLIVGAEISRLTAAIALQRRGV